VATASAGGWTKELGQVYVKAGGDVYFSDRYVAPAAPDDADQAEVAEVDGGSYLGQQYALYGEAGLLKAWRAQLAVSAPLVIVGARTLPGDAMGTYSVRASAIRSGDLRAAAQVALHPKLPLALSVDVKIPAYRNDTVGQEFMALAEIFPKPGDGNVDVGAMLFAGASPGPGTFLEAGAGFVHRTELFLGFDTDVELSDGARLQLKGGHVFGPFIPVLGIEATLSPAATTYTKSYAAAYATALVDVVEGLAIEPRFSYDLYARSTSRGVGAGLGLSYRR
jgi:hypothetical protein